MLVWTPEDERSEFANPTGVLVAPGTYNVAMYRRVDGELTALNQDQQFDVITIREPTLPGSSQEQRIAFARQVDEMQRAVGGTLRSVDEVLAQLDAIKETLHSSTADLALYAQANSIQQSINQVRDRLQGNATRGRFSDPGRLSVRDRLRYAGYDPNRNAHGPTQTQRDTFAIALDAYAGIGPDLSQLIDVEYAQLLNDLDEAGVPWTPGRGILLPTGN